MRSKKPATVMMTIPIPRDVRAWLEVKAARDLAPMSSEIVMALRQQMAAELRAVEIG